MLAKCPNMSRRKGRFLYRSAAVLSLVLWLALAAAEAWGPFHAWLHGGSIPDTDNCPVAALQQGKLVTSAAAAVVVLFLASVVAFRFVVFPPFVASLPLPDVRGPPGNRLAVVAF